MSTFPFRFYDQSKQSTLWRGNLPHLEQNSVCYFVTFMAKDAMPKEAKESWRKRRSHWLRKNGLREGMTREEILNRLPYERRRRFDRMLSAEYNRSLDKGAGVCHLRKREVRIHVVNALSYHANRTCFMADYVIMPNHVHVLIQPFADQSLCALLGSIRSYSSRMMNQAEGRSGPFWAKEPFDHIVRSRHFFDRYQRYIQANPARARLSSGMYSAGSFWPSG